jgi:hypothetical protein
MIDRQNWWKPFVLGFVFIGIIFGGAELVGFLYRIFAPQKVDEAGGAILAWGAVTLFFFGLPAIALLIGGVAAILIQFFRKEPPGSILNPNSTKP